MHKCMCHLNVSVKIIILLLTYNFGMTPYLKDNMPVFFYECVCLLYVCNKVCLSLHLSLQPSIYRIYPYRVISYPFVLIITILLSIHILSHLSILIISYLSILIISYISILFNLIRSHPSILSYYLSLLYLSI